MYFPEGELNMCVKLHGNPFYCICDISLKLPEKFIDSLTASWTSAQNHVAIFDPVWTKESVLNQQSFFEAFLYDLQYTVWPEGPAQMTEAAESWRSFIVYK